MANRVKIEIVSQPANYSLLRFSVAKTGYYKLIAKTFIPGFDSSPDIIVIGADAEATLNNLHAKLSSFDVDGNISFELAYPFIYCNFTSPDDYVLTLLDDAGTAFEVTTEAVTLPEPEVLEPLNLKHISIRLFDTYVNERILIQELAGADACTLDWDGGDDLHKALNISKLVFNMLVPEADDAHFLHLFSGDEQRYRVEVVAIDEEENEQLIWQGFLLPDQYNEPYKNVSFFVDFTATDMIGSLKGKYLYPWFYQNTIPIAEVLAYCFSFTGLQQNMIVKPSIVPDGDLFTWAAIGVDMRAFIDGDKYDDCFTIIEKLIGSNVMQLFSFRGYWWLEGVHRRGEVETTNFQFDTAGIRIDDIVTTKDVIDCGAKLSANAPLFTALTPWKRVNVEFKPDGTKNLFSEEVVRIPKDKQFYSYYKAIGYNLAVSAIFQLYAMIKLNKWIKNLTSDFVLPISWTAFVAEPFTQNYAILYWRNLASVGSSDYNLNEAAALNKYIECPEKPFLKPGLLYEFELQFTVDGINPGMSESAFEENIDEGYYDRLVPFQVFINNVEKYSNRPSFSSTTNLRYEVDKSNNGTGIYKLTFKLKFTFNTDVEGILKFRVLMPIIEESSGGDDNISFDRVSFDLLKLEAIEGHNENEDLVADRPINYTQELDHELDFSCTVDNSVRNSFSIGYPVDSNYFHTIDRTDGNADFLANHFFAPTTSLDLNYSTFNVPASLIETLFEKGFKAACFLEKVSGDKIPFTSLWYFLNDTNSKLAFLKSYTGFPVIPKKYKAYSDVDADDVLKYMQVRYATEDFSNRLNWKLYGSETIDTFPKTIAKALHGVRPEQIYRLDATALCLLFPDNLIDFYFDDNNRNFIPTKLTLNLFNGKTTFVATEAKFTELTDISYE